LLGPDAVVGRDGDIVTVATLDEAARAAVALRRRLAWAPSAPDRGILERARALRARLGPGRTHILGLYSGGTLAHEARILLAPTGRAEILDLGADEYTVGRPHPMLDAGARVERMREAARSADLAVLLLDVVLGHGAAPDPAGDLADAIAAVSRAAAVVASVVGTPDDPQNYAAQVARLEAAGAWVLPSNAEAACAAAALVECVPWSPPLRAPAGARPSAFPPPAPRGPSPSTRVADFLRAEVCVVNLGLEAFALDLGRRGIPVVHVAWTPPAGGDARLARLLARLE
jgi:FdrA protein